MCLILRVSAGVEKKRTKFAIQRLSNNRIEEKKYTRYLLSRTQLKGLGRLVLQSYNSNPNNWLCKDSKVTNVDKETDDLICIGLTVLRPI